MAQYTRICAGCHKYIYNRGFILRRIISYDTNPMPFHNEECYRLYLAEDSEATRLFPAVAKDLRVKVGLADRKDKGNGNSYQD